MNRIDYKGMKIQTNGNPDKPEVKVFAASCFLRPLHVTTSLDLAMRWIDQEEKTAKFKKDMEAALKARFKGMNIEVI